MRINKWLAQNTDLSRRKADDAVANGNVRINEDLAELGSDVSYSDIVKLNGMIISQQSNKPELWMLNKPAGYICSRDGQGAKTIYDLLPLGLQKLNPVGRLDKDSSGLLLLTNDGNLQQQLSHPSFGHQKTYEVTLGKALSDAELELIVNPGVDIGDERLSQFMIEPTGNTTYKVTLHEGRNRQVRRTFEALKNRVNRLHRVSFGEYNLGELGPGKHKRYI
ncbi:MAG: rRNA pseudouridine synthase [bacterium]|nr:rRNA pseudouridine synthase [bacterium]